MTGQEPALPPAAQPSATATEIQTAAPAPAGPVRPARAGWAGWAARLRRLSPTAKITYAGAALVLALIVVVSLAGGGGPGAPRPALPLAKGFTLPELGQGGQHISLGGYAGRPVIVNFFASWCGPCQRETPLLARFYRASRGRVAVIGIDANDKTGPAMRFLHGARVGYPVGADPFPAATTTSYGVIALPQTFFIDARHRIVKRIFGAVTIQELRAGVALMDRRG